MYTPFDLYIEKTRAAATVLEPKYPPAQRRTGKRPPRRSRPQRNRSRSRLAKKSNPKVDLTETISTLAFHREYVLDVNTLVEGVTGKQERYNKLQKEIKKIQNKGGPPMELRVLAEKKKAYLVRAPEIVTSSNSKNTDKQQPKPRPTNPSASFVFTRYIFLNAVDRLILLQETENDKIRQREREIGCCP